MTTLSESWATLSPPHESSEEEMAEEEFTDMSPSASENTPDEAEEEEEDHEADQLRASLSTLLSAAAALKPPMCLPGKGAQQPRDVSASAALWAGVGELRITPDPREAPRRRRRRRASSAVVTPTVLVGFVLVAFGAGYYVGRSRRLR